MYQISEVMEVHPEYCNLETRVSDLKYIFDKYNFSKIIVVDSEHHPLGLISLSSVSDDSLNAKIHPFDVKAAELMQKMSINVKKDASLEECLDLMENNHFVALPVVDEKGECIGLVDKESIIYHLRPIIKSIY